MRLPGLCTALLPLPDMCTDYMVPYLIAIAIKREELTSKRVDVPKT